MVSLHKTAAWKLVLATVLVLLTERFTWKGLAHPNHHHHDDVKPIFKALFCVSSSPLFSPLLPFF
ncbi:hypothetical protein ACSBR1_009780 [Camellia fascicularis]